MVKRQLISLFLTEHTRNYMVLGKASNPRKAILSKASFSAHLMKQFKTFHNFMKGSNFFAVNDHTKDYVLSLCEAQKSPCSNSFYSFNPNYSSFMTFISNSNNKNMLNVVHGIYWNQQWAMLACFNMFLLVPHLFPGTCLGWGFCSIGEDVLICS